MKIIFCLILIIFSNISFARNSQSKELLGYKKSKQITSHKTVKNIPQQLLRILQARLPKKYKKDAKLIQATILSNSKKYDLDPIFVAAVIAGESSFNPEALGPVQEIGLMQLRPHVAKWVTEDLLHKKYDNSMLKNPYENIRIGTRYLSWLRTKFPRSSHYIAAYNMGPGNIKLNIKKNITPKDYPIHVMKRYLAFYKE